MADADRLYWLHALTPLHVGIGRGEGYIDLPVLREKVTNFPFVPGSSTKGVFADACGASDDARDPQQGEKYKKNLHAAFGSSGVDLSNAGVLIFTDARLTCLAVRSLYGTFAWCTSPLVLQRLTRDLESAGFADWPAALPPTTVAHVPDQVASALVHQAKGSQESKIYLEDLDISVRPCRTAQAWATHLAKQLFADKTWRDLFASRFVVLPDELFDFLAETATEVQAHVKIDPDFKRVQDGALWYEESLPAESILCGLVCCDEPRRGVHVPKNDVLDLLQNQTLQMGGKATTGKGRVQLRFSAATSTPDSTSTTAGGGGA